MYCFKQIRKIGTILDYRYSNANVVKDIYMQRRMSPMMMTIMMKLMKMLCCGSSTASMWGVAVGKVEKLCVLSRFCEGCR